MAALLDRDEPRLAALLGSRFTQLEPIGRGGFSLVYRAHDARLSGPVALKMLRENHPDEVIALRREFRYLREHVHPHVVVPYELIELPDQLVLVMEFIEGESLIEHVERLPMQERERRICELFCELADSLQFLHASGLLHRDLKPDNLLVRSNGKLALIDLGIALEGTPLEVESQDGAIMGTIAYMAPEQPSRIHRGPTSDWYGFAVTLHEVFSGKRLFSSRPEDLARRRGVAPGELSGLPAGFAPAVSELLDPSPDTRAGPARLIQLLETRSGREVRHYPPPLFRGRVAELGFLLEALDDVWAGTSTVVRIVGESGIGKSRLVDHFLKSLSRASPSPLVLRSECHPQASILFNAVAPLIDGLSDYFADLSPVRLEPLLPVDAAYLTRLFPVLRRSAWEDVAEIPHATDAAALRHRAVAALCELLQDMSAERPLVLWVDDAQWMDSDSEAVLRAILRSRGPFRLMLILSQRPDFAERPGDDAVEPPWQLSRLDLAGLPAAEAARFASQALQARTPEEHAVARRIAEDSGGAPFLLQILTDAAVGKTYRPKVASADRLIPQLLRERVARVGPQGLRLVELVALSGRPLPVEVALDAARLGGSGARLVLELCQRDILRRCGADQTLDVYHDRLRSVTLEDLDPERRHAAHRALADALGARGDVDPEVVLEHLVGCGDAGAADCAARAAERAQAALAFGHAARRFRQAFELRAEREGNWELLSRHAQALCDGGELIRAGEAFERAAETRGRASADVIEIASLRARAAEQYCSSGRLERGLELYRAALTSMGFKLPASAASAIRSSVLPRVLFWIKGYRSAALHPAPRLERLDELRLDALRGAAKATAMTDHALSDALSVRYLHAALASRDPSRICRALAMEASVEANLGGDVLRANAGRLIDHAGALAERTGDPYDRGSVEINRASIGWFRSEWASSRAWAERAIDTFTYQCAGAEWEVDLAHSFLFGALGELGEVAELLERLPRFLDRVRQRDDPRATDLYHSSQNVLVALARNDPETALCEADASLRRLGRERTTSQHLTNLMANTRALLYASRGGEAWLKLHDRWPSMRSAGFLRTDGIALQLRYLRACAALAAIGTDDAEREAWTPDALARVVRQELRAIRRSKLPNARPYAVALQAALAPLEGREQLCRQRLETAVTEFDLAGMGLHRECARLALGEIQKDPTARDAATSWMRQQGIVDATRMAASLFPRLALIVGPAHGSPLAR